MSAAVPMGTAWLMATRPRTLTAGFIPVLVGTAVAFHDGVMHVPAAVAALLGAMAIQIGTNLINDYYDFRRGADDADRLGPPRVTQQGLISPGKVLGAGLACFALAMLVGSYLVWHAGWPILVVGLVSVLCGYAYTGGPYPLAYHGLGDIFVVVFFGPVAVLGTYFVQAGTLSPLAAAASVPLGLLSMALLVVNNLRDIPTDSRVGKRTLAVRLGEQLTRWQYAAALLVAMLVPLALPALGAPTWVIAVLAAAPLAIPPLRAVFTQQGAALNPALAHTARLHMVYGLILAVTLFLDGGSA